MARIEQINELFKNELANLAVKDFFLDGGLITIKYVDCSSDLKNAKIGISVLPEGLSGTALKMARSKSSKFSNILRNKTRLRKIPKFNWVIDSTERKVAEIEEVFIKIAKEKETN